MTPLDIHVMISLLWVETEVFLFWHFRFHEIIPLPALSLPWKRSISGASASMKVLHFRRFRFHESVPLPALPLPWKCSTSGASTSLLSIFNYFLFYFESFLSAAFHFLFGFFRSYSATRTPTLQHDAATRTTRPGWRRPSTTSSWTLCVLSWPSIQLRITWSAPILRDMRSPWF